MFNGVGRIVERPNLPGDSASVSRDDLVFAEGRIHIANLSGHTSFSVNRSTCTARFKVQQKTTVDGGTGRFAGAPGTFAGLVSGSGVARRKADGSCDQQHPPLIEIDAVSGTGTLSY